MICRGEKKGADQVGIRRQCLRIAQMCDLYVGQRRTR